MSPSPGKSSDSGKSKGMQEHGLATLIVMIAVLAIIICFCCFAAPGVRALCKRCFSHCPIDDPDRDNASTAGDSTTPTIILLPYGRMLVVDRSVFAQLQADHTGIDFMELSANMIRAQQLQTGSTPSILDSEATSKGLSPTSLGFSPPAYEDIFGEKNCDLPPSYSEISFLYRNTFSEQTRNNNRLPSANSDSGMIELQTRVNPVSDCDSHVISVVDQCIDEDTNIRNQHNQAIPDENHENIDRDNENTEETDQSEPDNECYIKESSI